MKKALILLSITIATLWATAGSAGAADKGTFELTDISQTASWSGEMQVSPVPVLPAACVPDVCDIVQVDVELPDDVWNQPGGMLVATEPPPNFTNINTFDLYVYGPDGQQVGMADSQWSAGSHAVWVENPANGIYTIYVAPAPPSCCAVGNYDGLVSFDRGLTVKREEKKEEQPYTREFVTFGASEPLPAVELLPDLIPTAPDNFHIETGFCLNFDLCSPDPAHQPSCYAEETSGETSHEVPPSPGPTRCLRFDQGEYNFGDGPLELHIYPEHLDPLKATDVYQRVYRSDGSVDQYPVGESVFHANHGHFHYNTGAEDKGWWKIELRERLPNGQPGEVKSSFKDKGVCALDVANGRFGQRRDGPQGYGNDDFNPCQTPRNVDPNDPTFPNSPYIMAGISVGWTDIYPWFVLDQYLDITTVPDGQYVIVTQEDPGERIHEKTRANNTSTACVEISGTTGTACPQPDLRVTMADSPDPVPVGGILTYAIEVTNSGTEPEHSVTLSDLLPKNVRLSSARSDHGRCAQRTLGRIECNLAELSKGESATVMIVVRPTKAGTIVNAATVSGEPIDVYPDNNTAIATTEVTR